MRDYVHTFEDQGGVHLNSGIPNHAFYLAARALGGHVWERAGVVWYAALCMRLHAHSTFADAAAATLAEADEHFGATAAEQVRGAWAAVGVTPTAGEVTRAA
jgi:Zn-dependent metalloprotease